MTPALAPHLPLSDPIQLWLGSLDPSRPIFDLLRRFLTPEEEVRSQRLLRPRDRRRWTASRGWLRLVLASYLEVPPDRVGLGIGDHGKPRVSRSDLGFNLSHSQGSLLLGVAHGADIGVDIEVIDRGLPVEALARSFLATDSRERLLQLPPGRTRDHAFYRAWTRQEAYLKGIGRGLAAGSLDSPALAEENGWAIQSLELGEGVAAAVAIRGAQLPLELPILRVESLLPVSG